MTIIESILLGIIEGITEFLPISSTGHLILASKLLSIPESEFLKSFEITIQLGAIAAVIVLYYKSLFDFQMLKKLFVAFLPTALVGLLLYSFVKAYLFGNERVVLLTLFFGGIALIAFELFQKEKTTSGSGIQTISYSKALLIGLFQSIAIIPGVSRSAATMVGGLLLGIGRKTIVEFSFLLAIPTILAATGLDIVKNASLFSSDQFWVLIVGFVSAFVVAIAAIKFLLRFVQNHTFIPFGAYRILAALAFWFFVL